MITHGEYNNGYEIISMMYDHSNRPGRVSWKLPSGLTIVPGESKQGFTALEKVGLRTITTPGLPY